MAKDKGKWKILEVLEEGQISDPTGNGDDWRTTKIKVQFGWDVEVREFAPTIDLEGIKRTLDSIVRDHYDPPKLPTPKAKDLTGLTS